ncbi:MAG: choice-of-anchor D domain-containing protein [Ignavibacteriaceae bacterium]
MNNIYAQRTPAQLEIGLDFSDDLGFTFNNVIAFGIDPLATDGYDRLPYFFEDALPPWSPALEVRFAVDVYESYTDIRYAPSFPYSGTKISTLKWQVSSGATTLTVNYDFPTGVSVVISSLIGTSPTLEGAGSYTIANANIVTQATFTVTYENVTPPVSGPVFDVTPASPLTITPTAVGGSNSANVTVSNTGTDALDITGVTSSNGEFSVAPTTANIPVGGNQVFVVTFSPATLGNKTSDLEFSHNGTNGSTTLYVVNSVGADAGPTFSVTPSSLDFGSISTGGSASSTVTVTNTGLTNPLSITSAATSAPYSVSPSSANIPALGSQDFTVTFSPTSSGSFPGTLTFSHNAAGSTFDVSLSGGSFALSGLVFEKDSVERLEDSVYTDILQLKNLTTTKKLQALSFKLLSNYSVSDDTILTFLNIQKGSDVSDASWLLQYNVKRGYQDGSGAQDTIIVLLYNSLQNNGLTAGSYDDLLKFKYKTANLPALKDSASSSFTLIQVKASDFNGDSISVIPSPKNELIVNVKNRVSSYGDVNGDGYIDILDLIDVVDHILERRLLTGDNFTRANIAPWSIGQTSPTPDDVVNVQDLTVIQNIILTGFLPSGTQLNKSFVIADDGTSLQKSESAQTKVQLYVTKEGISVKLNSEYAIRGAQLEFKNINGNTSNMIIDSRLGGGYFNYSSNLLRVLLYDQAGNAVIDAGQNFMANIPFALNNPGDISLDKIILVNTENKKVKDISVEVIYSNAPEIPVEYSLSQNYPNPFNPSTRVQFSVPKEGLVTIKVYNMLGQEVTTLFSGNAQRGMYTLNWNGKDKNGNVVSSGSYIYKMSAGDFTQSKKMIFLK